METTSKPLLPPLPPAAAFAVPFFRAAGVAALPGLLPHAGGRRKDAGPVVTAVSEKPQPSIEPSMPAAAAVATPVAKPKPVHRVAKPQPAQPAQIAEAAPIAQAPQPAVPAGVFGTVESVKEVTTPGDGSSGVGAIGGGIAGAVIRNQFGHGTGRLIMTAPGAAGGAPGGKENQKQHKPTKSSDGTRGMGARSCPQLAHAS